MRRRNLLFGIATLALTVGTVGSLAWSQEEGRRGPPGGAPGGAPGGGRGGPGGGFRGPGGGGGGGIQSLLRMEEVQKEIELTEAQKGELMALMEKQREAFSSMRPTGGRPEGGRPEGDRPEGGRPEGGRPEGGRGPGGGFNFNPEQMKEMMTRMKEARDKAEAEIMTLILDPIQGDRVLGLLAQYEDGRSLLSNPLADAVGLTPDQKKKLTVITDNFNAERMKMMESMFRGGPPGGGGGGADRFQEMNAQRDTMEKKVNADLLAVMSAEQKAKFEELKGAKFTFPERTFGVGGPGGGSRSRGGPPGEGGAPREGARPGRPEGPTNN